MQANFLSFLSVPSVSRAAQPERRKEELEQAGNVPTFQWRVHLPRRRSSSVNSHSQSPLIPNTRPRENAFGRYSYLTEYCFTRQAIPIFSADEAQSEADEAQLEADFEKMDDYRADIPPEKRMTRQKFQHYSGMKKRSIQKVPQDMLSEVSNQPPPNEAELQDTLVDYSNLWNRRKVAAWKESFGRSKEWRSCRFVKANEKHLTGKFFTRKEWPTKMGWKHSPPAVPINMLRRDASFRLRFRTRPPRVATPTIRYPVHEEFWGTYNSDTDDRR
jgi:hypothetical protein